MEPNEPYQNTNPKDFPDYRVWIDTPIWRYYTTPPHRGESPAVSLLLNLDPDREGNVFHSGTFRVLPNGRERKQSDVYSQVSRMIRAAIDAGELKAEPAPKIAGYEVWNIHNTDLVAWANAKPSLKVPEPFLVLLESQKNKEEAHEPPVPSKSRATEEQARAAQPAITSDGAGCVSGYKDIADYLGKSVSTVKRWEKGDDLPVIHAKGTREPMALRQDLDRWVQSRPPKKSKK